MGDAAGIGPEIIVKLHVDQTLPVPTVVYGDAGVLQDIAKRLHLKCAIERINNPGDLPSRMPPNTLYVLERRPPLPNDLCLGQIHAEAGRAAYDYLCHAIDDAQAEAISAIVTAPLNKEAMQAGGIDFPGHTEILAHRTGTTDYAMMLANPELRVILVTIHVALSQVFEHITIENQLRTMHLAHKACLQAGLTNPRIAVAGLNPHAGENGRFGREELEVIEPAIAQARAQGLDVSGPWPGDTVFMRARRGDFDIVVAQYHDQGLIPVKYLGVDQGVNVTIGLPFVRTSVDHGTAYNIAGQGLADPASLHAAYEMAVAMT